MGLFLPSTPHRPSLPGCGAPRQQAMWRVSSAGLLIALAHTSATLAQSVASIGTSADVKGISADGSMVVGRSSETGAAFVWTSTGIESLGYADSTAYAVSADGTVVVGDSLVDGGYYRAFRWVDGDMKILALSSDGDSNAYGISDDGKTIVGRVEVTDGNFTPAYWTDDGDVLSFLDEGAKGTAYGVNGDGTVIVGQYESTMGKSVAFRWTTDGFDPIAGPSNTSVARAVNPQGNVVVGSKTGMDGYEMAFRWTKDTSTAWELGVVDPSTRTSSIAYAVNAVGNVVVGTSWNAIDDTAYTAFYWKEGPGLWSLAEVLAFSGVDLDDWILESATGVSADGTIVVGTGVDASGEDIGYIARVGVDAVESLAAERTAGVSTSGGGSSVSGLITTDVLLRSALSMTALTEAGNDYLDRLLQAHSASVSTCTDCVFSSGLGGTLRGDDPAATLLVGGKRELQPGITFGGSFATFATETPLVYDGSIGTIGNVATVFAKATTSLGLTFSGTISGNMFAADITRGYLNGNAPAASHGGTSGRGIGASFTVAWTYPVTERFTLTPFTGVSAAVTQVDGWTESGGPFPAIFAPIVDPLAVQRLGGTARVGASDRLQLWGELAWAHRYNSSTTGISATVLGASDIAVGGAVVEQDWIEVSAGIDMPIFDDAATLSASLTASLTPTETFFQLRSGVSQRL